MLTVLQHLPRLATLNLKNAYLTGSIPHSLYLPNLQSLNLHNNNIKVLASPVIMSTAIKDSNVLQRTDQPWLADALPLCASSVCHQSSKLDVPRTKHAVFSVL